jgi:hypothetical protein
MGDHRMPLPVENDSGKIGHGGIKEEMEMRLKARPIAHNINSGVQTDAGQRRQLVVRCRECVPNIVAKLAKIRAAGEDDGKVGIAVGSEELQGLKSW